MKIKKCGCEKGVFACRKHAHPENKATYTLTTINVQGDAQEAFEVYSDKSKAQTVGFVFDEKYVDFARAVNSHDELLTALKTCRYQLVEHAKKSGADYILKQVDKAIAKAERG